MSAAAPARIVAFFEQLAPADTERIGEFYAPDTFFRDPFNDVRGVAEISRVFRHMFDELADGRFVITETITGDAGAAGVGFHIQHQEMAARHDADDPWRDTRQIRA